MSIARNAFTLYGSTIVTSALGFGFWWLAARTLTTSEVGYASASISAMQLIGATCVFGVNTLIISELSHDKSRSTTLITTGVVVTGLIGIVVSLVAASVMIEVSNTFRTMLGNPLAFIAFVVGAGLTTAMLVVDDACVGLFKGEAQFKRNAMFAALKLALIPLIAFLLPHSSGLQLLLAWVVATAVSIWLVRFLFEKPLDSTAARLDPSLVVARGRLAMNHHWLNIAVQSPRYALPVVATVMLGPHLSAGFYAAVLIVGFINVIPSHLSTVLFALKPGDDDAMSREVKFTMRICVLLAFVSAPILIVASRIGLSLFNASYKTAATALCVLAFTTLPAAIKSHYVVISRVKGRMARAAWLASGGAVVEIAGAVIGASIGGLTGIAAGLLIAQVVEALLFGPTVLRVLRRPAPVDVTDEVVAGSLSLSMSGSAE